MNNVFFEQHNRRFFGNLYGYAVEYFLIDYCGETCISFAEKLIMPEDPQNWKKPYPIDLVSELIFCMAKDKRAVSVFIYGTYVRFTDHDSVNDIKNEICKIQKNLIKVEDDIPYDIRNYINNAINDFIKGMPVH